MDKSKKLSEEYVKKLIQLSYIKTEDNHLQLQNLISKAVELSTGLKEDLLSIDKKDFDAVITNLRETGALTRYLEGVAALAGALLKE